MRFLRIRSRKRRVALGLLLIPGVVVIDLLFSAHPALSIGIFLSAVALIAVVRLVMLGRLGHRRSDKQR